MMKRSPLLFAALLAVLLNAPAQAQSYYQEPGLENAVAAFGGAVAVGDREIFISEAMSFKSAGLVHVYRRVQAGDWGAVATLKASDGAINDGFGEALAVSGGTLLVGTTRPNNRRGAVYVFQRDAASGHWSETARLTAHDGAEGDQLGAALAVNGNYALVGAAHHNENTGAVYVYRRNAETDTWAEHGKLVGSDLKKGNRFGAAIAMDGGRALVSAPNDRAGAVYVYRLDSETGTWAEEARLSGNNVGVSNSFGAALHLHGDEAFIGAPRDNSLAGSVHVFRHEAASQTWTRYGKLEPNDEDERAFFGSVVQGTQYAIWVGAPGVNGFAGLLYRFERDASGQWLEAAAWAEDSVQPRDRFAGTFALRSRVAVVGAAGAAYGEGMAIILERNPVKDAWEKRFVFFNENEAMDPITGSQVDCDDGTAAAFACSDVDLISFLPLDGLDLARGVRLNDVWGWTDPQTDHEYALVGHLEGTVFVDLSDPFNPIYLGNLPRTAGTPGSTWRDIKVYKDHAFIVADGAGEHGMQVFDLNQLREVTDAPVTFEATAHYDKIHSAHNIVINEETGYAFSVGSSGGGETCGGGLHMINIQEPTAPTFVGCFADATTGRRKTGYSHDAQCVIYHGPDAEHQGKEICFGSNETAISISDVTDKDNPVPIGSGSYPDYGYIHQGWLSEDQRYFFQNDELDEMNAKVDRTRTLIWDVSDLDDPVMVKEYYGDASSTDHNLYIKDNLMYQTNNASGLRIIDVTDPENPVEVGYFDTTPDGLNEANFDGTWSSYPYFKSGMIVVTSRREGLFVLKKRAVDI